LEIGITGHNFERGPSKDHSTKVWLQLAKWFLRRKFGCGGHLGRCSEMPDTILILTYITGFFMYFEFLPILTDYAN
jgi:hypothetical protein